MKVLLPTPLVDYTGGKREVSATGATLDAALADLDRQFSGIRFRMIDEQHQVRAHIKLFVNRNLERDLQRPLADSDELLVVAALSGG